MGYYYVHVIERVLKQILWGSFDFHIAYSIYPAKTQAVKLPPLENKPCSEYFLPKISSQS